MLSYGLAPSAGQQIMRRQMLLVFNTSFFPIPVIMSGIAKSSSEHRWHSRSSFLPSNPPLSLSSRSDQAVPFRGTNTHRS